MRWVATCRERGYQDHGEGPMPVGNGLYLTTWLESWKEADGEPA